MNKLVSILVVIALAAYGYHRFQIAQRHALAQAEAARAQSFASTPAPEQPSLEQRSRERADPDAPTAPVYAPSTRSTPADSMPASYRCDGRTRCPQMHSCEEATWFLRNCPGTTMDGDNDGVPCETQWCSL